MLNNETLNKSAMPHLILAHLQVSFNSVSTYPFPTVTELETTLCRNIFQVLHITGLKKNPYAVYLFWSLLIAHTGRCTAEKNVPKVVCPWRGLGVPTLNDYVPIASRLFFCFSLCGTNAEWQAIYYTIGLRN